MIHKIIKAMVEGKLLEATFKAIWNTPKKIMLFFTKVRRKIDKIISLPAINIMARTIPVEGDKIMFITFRGEYDCNAKWITQEMLNRDLPYKIVWTIRKGVPENILPEEFTLVYRGTYEFYKHLASAKIIVDNGVSTSYLGYKKKKDQILLETWHGSLGIKKFSKNTVKDKIWVAAAFMEGAMTDYIISNSTFEDAVYREDYWKETRILKLGHARNDILCERDTERLKSIRKRIFKQYKLGEETKICLYAPTFRDDGDMRPYRINYENLKEALESKFGGNWVIFIRFHFRMLKKIKRYKFGEGVINASDYPDIQELLTCTDVGITDYSSWICDYMLTERPGFLFATDMAEYEKKDREFFYPLDTMPFPLALNNKQLIHNILNFDNEMFVQKCRTFLQEKGCIDDGHASERAVDAIEKIMKGEQL